MSALLLAAALAGPPAAAATDPVRVRPVGVENVRMGLGHATFDLVVEAERLKGLPVVLRTLDYAIVIDRVRVAQTVGDYRGQRLRLKKGEPVRFTLPVELNAAEALALATQGISEGLGLRVKLSGKAGVRLLFLPLTVPFRTDLVRLDP